MKWNWKINKSESSVEQQEYMAPVIALHGPAGAGKNEFANGLLKSPLVKTFAFADKLKQFAYAANPYVEVWEPGGPKYYRLQDVVASLGWEEAKKIPDVRRFIQRVGTEAGQNVIDKLVWANLVRDQIYFHLLHNPNAVCVITDLRFPHELSVLNSMAGIDLSVVKIIGGNSQDALSTPETKNHVSEKHSLPYHYLIENDLKKMDKDHLHAYAGGLLYMITMKTDPKPELRYAS